MHTHACLTNELNLLRFKLPKPGNRVWLPTFNWSTTVVTSFSSFVVRSTPSTPAGVRSAIFARSDDRIELSVTQGIHGREWALLDRQVATL